jgi:dTMP kinase
MFITFEGLDASGKSTQAELTANRFRESGASVVFIREPGGTDLGERIRSLLLDVNNNVDPVAEVFLFSAARAQLVREVIRPALARGEIVICDRFVDSTTSYQGYGRKIPMESIRAINRLAIDGVIPDLTFFIDISIDEIEKRQHAAGKIADRMERSGRTFFERTRNGYIELSRNEKRLKVIQGERSPDRIFNEIWSIIQDVLQRSSIGQAD